MSKNTNFILQFNRLDIKSFASILLFLAVAYSKAQFNNIWHFGNGAGLNFSPSPPSNFSGGQIFQPDNSSTISDGNGNLLFYTNGINVWNKNHLIMPNGSGLIGNPSAGQSALIVPVPCSKYKYFIFHVTEFSSPGHLNYSVVDMSLNNGLGDVVNGQKNISFGQGWTEKLCAIYNSSNKSFWIVTHKWNNDEFVAFEINSSATVSQTVTTKIGSIHNCGSYGSAHDAMGQLTISQDGALIVNALTCADKYELFQFNINTGILSNSISIPGNGDKAWGTAFSNNSKFLYVTTIFGSSIYQYDLNVYNQTSIVNSQFTVHNTFNPGYNFGYMELGPDNKIYVAKPPSSNILPVISNPNASGVNCNYISNYITLNSGSSTWGTSRIAYGIPQITGLIPLTISSTPSSTVCANQSTTLSVSGTSSYTWSNGTVGSNIVVTPSASVEYSVSAPASACSAGTNSIRLEVVPQATVSSLKSICFGQNANIKDLVASIQVLGQNPINTSGLVSPTVSTVYSVQVANNSGTLNCWATQTVQVNVNPNPETDFKYNINSCGGGVQFTDLSSSEIASWLWTLESDKTFTIQNPYYFFKQGGLYTVTLTTSNVYGCAKTSLKTFSTSTPPPVSINTASRICKGKSAQLNASGGNAYEWRPTQYLDFPNVSNPLSKAETNINYSVIITTPYHNTTCELMLTTSVQVDELSSHKPYVTTSAHALSIGESADLKYNGDAGAFVSWSPPTIPLYGYEVKTFPIKNTTYTAIATKGTCSDTFYVKLNAFTAGCLMEDVFVPNTFTPNNDGKNDKLFVRGEKIEQLLFSIYNRWGEKVFETNDIHQGWDGTYNTSPLDAGVFGWHLKVQCINGGEVFLKGNVSLVR